MNSLYVISNRKCCMLTFTGESQLCTNHSGFQDIPAIIAHSAIAFSAINTHFYSASMIARASHQPNTAWGACYTFNKGQY